MKKSKLFAPFLMLLAGAVASIMMYHFDYGLKQMLIILSIVLLAFYIAGFFIQKKVISFMEQIKEEEEKEGEVIEKDAEDDSQVEVASEGAENEAEDEA